MFAIYHWNNFRENPVSSASDTEKDGGKMGGVGRTI